jgi:hypothetical protein
VGVENCIVVRDEAKAGKRLGSVCSCVELSVFTSFTISLTVSLSVALLRLEVVACDDSSILPIAALLLLVCDDTTTLERDDEEKEKATQDCV